MHPFRSTGVMGTAAASPRLRPSATAASASSTIRLPFIMAQASASSLLACKSARMKWCSLTPSSNGLLITLAVNHCEPCLWHSGAML